MRGPCVFHTNGNMTINGVDYPPGDPTTADGMADAQAFQEAFDSCVSELASGDDDATPFSERFTAVIRRLHTHINAYNPIIAFLIRSNMDLKVLLRDSDAKGILFYILNYATKTEQTLDVLLPLLLPVVERIRDESADEPSKEIAVQLVRSCLCKQLTSLNIGGPAAASKLFGLPDAKMSHKPISCPTRPLLAWASSRDGPRPAAEPADDEQNDNTSEDDSEDDTGVIVSAVRGKLTVNQRAFMIYRHRCDPNDTGNPLHRVCYFSWHRLVRLERYDQQPPETTVRPGGEDEGMDDHGSPSSDDIGDPSGDEVDEANVTPKRGGRPSCNRYECVGPFKKEWVQVRDLC